MKSRNITRTISTTTFEVLVFDKEKNAPDTFVFALASAPDDNEKALKLLRETFNTSTIEIVYIVSRTEAEHLYSMPEDTFLKFAEMVK